MSTLLEREELLLLRVSLDTMEEGPGENIESGEMGERGDKALLASTVWGGEVGTMIMK